MVHDVRDLNKNFFPKRYSLPSFLTWKKFKKAVNFIGYNNIIRDYDFSFTKDFIEHKNNSILTFDDGLKDHLKVAEFLSERNINSIFFVPAEAVLKNKMINSHKIQFILASTSPKKLIDLISKNFIKYSDKSIANLNSFYISKWKKNIWPKEMVFITRILREGHDTKWRNEIINFLFNKFVTNDEVDFSSQFYLSESEVLQISKMGHCIGGHGNKSEDLRYLNKIQAKHEIEKSSEFIKKFNPLHSFYAFANGGYTENTKTLLKKNSFTHSFTTEEANWDLNSDTMSLPRFDLTKLQL